MKNLKSHPMYWLYNILLLIYWATLIPMLIYRLIHEEGFYQRIKQSIGFLPDELKEKIFTGEIEDAKTVASLLSYAVKYEA